MRRGRRNRKFRIKAQENFLKALEETGIVTRAANLSGVTHRTIYDYRHQYPEFARRWDDIISDHADKWFMQAVNKGKEENKKIKSKLSEIEQIISPKENDPRIIKTIQAKFISTMIETSNVTKSAKAAGVSKSTIYRYRRKYPEFAEAWDEAYNMASDKISEAVWERAIDGAEKPIIKNGEIVSTYTDQSERMLELLYKHRVARQTDKNRIREPEKINEETDPIKLLTDFLNKKNRNSESS